MLFPDSCAPNIFLRLVTHGAGSFTGAASRRRLYCPRLRPAISPLRLVVTFDLSCRLQVGPRAASLQNTASAASMQAAPGLRGTSPAMRGAFPAVSGSPCGVDLGLWAGQSAAATSAPTQLRLPDAIAQRRSQVAGPGTVRAGPRVGRVRRSRRRHKATPCLMPSRRRVACRAYRRSGRTSRPGKA